MAKTIKFAKNLSRRTLSVVLACAVLAVMMLTVLAGAVLFSKAATPSALEALNHEVPVQSINMMPTTPGKTTYIDNNDDLQTNGTSRTSFATNNGKDFEDYLQIEELDYDNRVKISVTQELPAYATNDTTYAWTYTKLNQMINLADNPYLSIAFDSSSTRLNGWINFTITRDGTTYVVNTANDTIAKLTNTSDLTWNNSQVANSGFDFYRIFNYRDNNKNVKYKSDGTSIDYTYDQKSGAGNKDFWVSSSHDETVDFYDYLYGYFEENGWINSYWPKWGTDGNYMTVTYVRHVLVSSGGSDNRGVGQPLREGAYALWKTCSLGRTALTQSDVLAPRIDEMIAPTNTDTQRRARLDDGRVVFRNSSTTSTATYQWDVKRFVNIVELQALLFDAQYSGSGTPTLEIAVLGRNLTKDGTTYKDHYTCKGFWLDMNSLIDDYSDQGGKSSPEKYRDVTVNLKQAIDTKCKTDRITEFYPDDNLICIREMRLTLPADSKLTINQFGVSIRNDFAASTTKDTVYPWSTDAEIDTLPPEGTPATSANLDSESGANSAVYNWAATETPIVENKVDLLAMTDQHLIYDSDGQYTGFETSDVTGYWRTIDGKSHFTSTTTDIVYREFHRRDKTVTEYDSTDGGNNYYMEIPVGTTPYLYYSYKLTGGTDKAVGLYFYIANEGINHNYYYLGQSGLSLLPCDNLINAEGEADVSNAYRTLCSTAGARTGIIDLRSLGFDDDDIVLIEDMRFYLTGTTTNATFDYLFFGSETLDDSVTSTIAKNSGDAFPWAITHDQFKDATLGIDSEFTFANRINVIDDMIDRKRWKLSTTASTVTKDEAIASFGSEMTYNSDGSITVTATGSRRYVQIGSGTGYDHKFAFKIDKNDLASLRYLNYSVSADAGMRWSIMFREGTSGTTGDQATALRTWSDAYMSGDFLTNNKTSKETVGKSYFREMPTSVLKKYWYNDNLDYADAQDKAWAMFTVPGSETGCFDLSILSRQMDWDQIVDVYFVVYKDPSLKDATGTADVSGSVTFNYLYLTSEPLTGSSYGAAAFEAGQSYSWPYIGTDNTLSFDGSYMTTYHYGEDKGTWGKDFYISANKEAVDFTDKYSTYSNYYSLYYGFTFTDKDGNPAYPDVHIGLFENSGGAAYRWRQRTGKVTDGTNVSDMQFGTSTLTGDPTTNDMRAVARGVYRMQMPETAAIPVNQMGLNGLQFVRVYYDATKYNCHVEYIVLACRHDHSTKYPTQTKTITALSSKTADFSDSLYEIDMGRTNMVTDGTTLTGTGTYTVSKTVDLYKTPYLFYSIEYAANQTGTFMFTTGTTAGGYKTFYRDGSVSELGSQNLIEAGTPGTANYMQQSETGCIDVRGWYERKGALPSSGILTISQLKMFLSGSGTATIRYMYFGAEADKTIDLIPSQAGGRLDSGVSTHSWSYSMAGSGELQPASSSTAATDSYITASQNGKPSTQVKYSGDTNGDNFNDLSYGDSTWGFHAVCYGEIMDPVSGGYTYVSTGNNQMSGLSINLSETPYLHFSITQSAESYTTFVLQANNFTSKEQVRNELPDKVRPWLSCYNSKSPAGQLVHVATQTQYITYYKDMIMPNEIMPQNNGTYNNGNIAGVIDLRTWFTDTNGFGDIVNLDRIRFYTTDMKSGKQTEATINHFYLSSSSGSAYSVTFEKNDGTGTKSVVQVLKNANDQYVSDETLPDGFKTRSGYTFVGWYTDEEWENYYDIDTQPIQENITLYAGWIKDSDVSTTEVNMLANAGTASQVKTLDGSGEWEIEDDALHIENTGSTEYIVQLQVNKAYSLYDFHSFYAGFDTSKTCEGASVVVDLKSLGSHTYDLLGDPFGSLFLTDSGVLTAAPYNKEIPVYQQLATQNLLPVEENENGYIYIKTVTFTLPVGASMHVRYLTAAKSMEVLDSTAVAPAIPSGALDLLDCTEDDVEQARTVTYELMDEKTEVYGSSQTFSQVHIAGPAFGYLTLGSLYGLGDTLGDFDIDANDQQYLYFSVSQTEESKTTFNMWCTVYYEDSAGVEHSYVPAKWSSFYNGATDAMGSQADMVNGNIPDEAYFRGSRTGCINLYDWYSTALEGTTVEGGTVTRIRISGLRLYSTQGGTDATFNYIAIGDEVSIADVKANVSYKNASGTTVTETFSDEQPGQSVNITLDSLTDCPAANDPSQTFLGWSFSSATGTPVYWNPNAKNDKQYNASSNPNGAWSASAVSGFVQQRADVTYQLTTSTATIYPVFDTSPAAVTLSVKFSGSGTVKVQHMDTAVTNSITEAATYSKTYGSRVVLSTTATNFAGWTDASGRLISASNECVIELYEDTTVTANFGTATTLTPDEWGDGKSIVWLQSSDLTAGSDFYLEPVNNGSLELVEEVQSNINDTTGEEEIVCYWALAEGQMVQAVTKSGYHWEQLLKDGSTMRVSEDNTYTFITSPNIKLISVKDDGSAFEGAVVYNEYAVSFDRSSKTAIVNTQIEPKVGEEIATCGIVIAPRPSGVKAPSYRSAESVKVTANAWNSTTGQFTVDCPFTTGKAYFIRAYAVMKNTTTGEYTLRYGDVTTITF